MKYLFETYTSEDAPEKRRHLIMIYQGFPGEKSKTGKVLRKPLTVCNFCCGATLEEAQNKAEIFLIDAIKAKTREEEAKAARLKGMALKQLHEVSQ